MDTVRGLWRRDRQLLVGLALVFVLGLLMGYALGRPDDKNTSPAHTTTPTTNLSACIQATDALSRANAEHRGNVALERLVVVACGLPIDASPSTSTTR